MDFTAFKEEIIRRAKNANACSGEYKRAYESKDFSQLIQVIKDNFSFAVTRNIIDPSLIDEYKEAFNGNQIYCNESVTNCYILACGNATVEASGNATVIASDNATVEAWNNTTVEAFDSATVEAWENATVEALDSAFVRASGNVTVRAWDNATVRALENATVEAWDNVTVRALDSAFVRASGNVTVRASGNAYVSSDSLIECKLSKNAIYRIRSTNTIRFASNDLNFEKIDTNETEPGNSN